MDDVARVSGLSRVTVSKIFNGRPVREKSRKRALEACEQLNFVPNRYATSLARGASRLLGLVVTAIDDPFYGQIIATAERTATESGFDLTYRCSFASADQERRIVERFLGLKVDGLIVSPVASKENISYWQTLSSRLPVVFIDHTALRACHLVASDHYRGERLVTEHLLSRSKRPAYLGSSEPLTNSAIAARLKGYKDAVRERGLEPIVLNGVGTEKRDSEALGYESIKSYLSSLGGKAMPFDALACATDAIALGAMAALIEGGYDPGRDVLVAGHDDSPFAAFISPSLTTVRQPREAIGRQSVHTTLQLIEAGSAYQKRSLRVRLDPELVIRESTAVHSPEMG
jgi:DNA-binding LacI/PurR family transcriptional regulator